jgi:hypothetical protein
MRSIDCRIKWRGDSNIGGARKRAISLLADPDFNPDIPVTEG